MDKLLVRIISGLVAVIAALGLFSFSVIELTNKVRFEHYWNDIAVRPMRFISDHADVFSHSLPDGMSLVSANHEVRSDAFNARIDADYSVLEERNGRLIFFYGFNDAFLLVMDSEASGKTVYDAYLWIIKSVLHATENVEQQQALFEGLESALNLTIAPLKDDSKLQSQPLLEALAEQGMYTYEQDDHIESLLMAPSAQLYQVVFPDRFSSLSWPLVLFLLVCVIGTFSLLTYWVIQYFDRRLRVIQTVASRIARGELDARVRRADDTDAINRLGLAFNSMADHIQRLMFVQKEMIHAVSHELRTPVARIRFGVQMIEDSPSEEALRKQIAGIDGDIQELDELIDEILTYARLEQGGPILAIQEADVSEIVEQVISEQSSVKPDMKIFSVYKEGSELWKLSDVEIRYIHRSIQNLVGNATRYAKSTVKVVCSFDKETCRVDVEDDGPGIPEEQWESVFTPFARLDDSRTRSSGGYGLGLSIVRRILFWHGGQAFLGRSEELGGAKFSLVWPRRQSEP